jgi:transcription termination factor Rho
VATRPHGRPLRSLTRVAAGYAGPPVPALGELHLAQLHERAAKLGIPRYRLLRREALIDEIERRAGEGEAAETPLPTGPEADRPRRERERLEETEAVSGVLDLTAAGHGFLRLRGLEPGDDDVYVSASQIRRCELRAGDEVAGPARQPRRGERHRALVHVDLVNGAEPPSEPRPELGALRPAIPSRRLALATDRGDVLVRAADLLAPLAFGQRVLVSAAPRSGRTTLLRGLAHAIVAGGAAELIVLLVDERPEEAVAWREELPQADLAIATAEMSGPEQVRVAALASERARRRAEAGVDAVLICDSLSRLAVAAGDTAEVKRLFGSGRELEGDGSLTVIATTLHGLADDGAAERAVETTENALITLDAELAAEGIFPALRPGACRVSGEEALRSPEELAAARRFRSLLADLEPVAAARELRERIEAAADNAELLRALA